MSFIPQLFEATVVAFMAQGLFDMPLSMGYVLGYNLACISPSIVVPGLMSLNDRGYGKKKNIASTLIASGTFDDIICIICFSICKTIVLNDAGFGSG
jgi:NhaP-type Na+/H+ or K+/H+ antiporter